VPIGGLYLTGNPMRFSLEFVVALKPDGASWLSDVTSSRDAERGDGGLAVVDELGVGLVEEVVNAKRERQVLVRTVGEAEREDAKPARGAVVRARDAAVALMIAVLPADEAPDGVCLHFPVAVLRCEIRLERGDLWERCIVRAVIAARVGERCVRLGGGQWTEVLIQSCRCWLFARGCAGERVLGFAGRR